MKRKMTMVWTLLLVVSLLAGCGGKGGAEMVDVDLDEYYDTIEEVCEWPDDFMADIEGELLDEYYPGLSDLDTEELIAKAPMMSAVVSEIVLVECKTEEDAAKAAEILNARIAYQVGDESNPGGAWYPESIEAWRRAEVIQNGNYVALLACSDFQSELAQSFNDLFA